MDNKLKYKSFIADKTIPIFMEYDWLEATTNGAWDAVVVEDNNEVKAVWPFFLFHSKGFSRLAVPPLTKYLRPILTNEHELQDALIDELIENLPKYHDLEINVDAEGPNLDKLLENGYSIEEQWTYEISNLDSKTHEELWASFKDTARRSIKKAEKQLNFEVSTDLKVLYKLNQEVFDRRGMEVPFRYDLLNRLDQFLRANDRCQLIVAKDADGKIVASMYFVWGDKRLYYLLGGIQEGYRKSGAPSKFIWEGVKLAKEKGLVFDFEGSMIPSIEKFFLTFRPQKMYYSKLQHQPSKMFSFLQFLKSKF